jgi:hypothetical protein
MRLMSLMKHRCLVISRKMPGYHQVFNPNPNPEKIVLFPGCFLLHMNNKSLSAQTICNSCKITTQEGPTLALFITQECKSAYNG